MLQGTFAGVSYPLPTFTPLADDQSARIVGDMVQAAANVKASPRLAGAIVSPARIHQLHGAYMGADAAAAPSGSGMLDSITGWVSQNMGLALAIGAGIVFLPSLMGGKRRR